MKIKRVIGGKEYLIELTHDELMDAKEEADYQECLEFVKENYDPITDDENPERVWNVLAAELNAYRSTWDRCDLEVLDEAIENLDEVMKYYQNVEF